jgi:hypothetical protein
MAERYKILKKYRLSLWIDKFKATVITFGSLGILTTSAFTGFAWGIGGYDPITNWDMYLLIGVGTYLMGGVFFSVGLWTFVLRGMFDCVEDYYIKLSADPNMQGVPAERTRIRGFRGWWPILKWGYARSDRLLVFDGFEGNRYYYGDGDDPVQHWDYKN